MAKAPVAVSVRKASNTQVVDWTQALAEQARSFFYGADIPPAAKCLGELYELCHPPISERNFMQRLRRLVEKGVLKSQIAHRRGRAQRVYWPADPSKPIKFF